MSPNRRGLLPALGGAAFAALLSLPAGASVSSVPMLLAAPHSTGSGSGTITLTNGPPNIAYASAGSCTTATCTWIQAGVSGEAVSDVYLDMSPMSSNYTGSFSLSGTNASNYSISTSSDGTRNVGHITTASSLSAGDDDITVSANGVSQRLTVHKVSGTSSGCTESGLSSASSSAGAGGIITIPASCTMPLTSSFQPSAANQVFIGAGASSSILDAQGRNLNPGFGVTPSQPSGVALMNVEIKNDNGSFNTEAIQMGENWVVRNIYSHDNGKGVSLKQCGDIVVNSRSIHNSYDGFGGIDNGYTCPSGEHQKIVGNEWAQNNTGGNNTTNDTCTDAGNKWITSSTATLDIYNNYVHDNYENGFWSDTNTTLTMNIYDNSFIANGARAIQIEQSQGASIYQNFFLHNYDGINPGNEFCGGSTMRALIGQVTLTGSWNTNIHDNNLVQAAGPNGTPNLIFYGAEGGNNQNNVTFHDNTVTFLSTSAGTNDFGSAGDLFYAGGAQDPTGTSASNNHYHLPGGNTSSDTHWNWFNSNTAQTFSQWKGSSAYCDGSGNCSAANPDSGTTASIDTDSTKQGSGCTHVACSGAGVGTGGVPQ